MTRRGSRGRKARGPSRSDGKQGTALAVPPFFTARNLAWALFLIVATVLAYRHAWAAGFIWDDDIYVTGNTLLTVPDGLSRIWFSLESPSQYFPLTYTTFRLERAVWGLNPTGYHWVNILLHAANAVLVWRLLLLLRVPGAWLAAPIFALHPVHVESVAWITERKNVLMGLFFLLSLISWVRFLDAKPGKAGNWYALALLFYAGALFSKTTACTLPAALLLIVWFKKKPITLGRLLQVVPFIVLGVALGLVTIWWERYHQGTQGQLFAIGLPERLLVASRAVWFYLGKLIWPVDLTFSYPRWNISVADPLDYVWPVATVAGAVVIYFLRRRFGRGLEVAAVFFVATLGPVLGFIMLYTFRYSFVADHYQYLASIGPIALAAAGLTITVDRFASRLKILQAVPGGLVVAALGLLTWNQCKMYADADTLWWMTIARNPQSWMAHNNIAISLVQQGRVEEAIAHYEKALALDPTYGEAHYNLANALVRLARLSDAIAHYEKAVELTPTNAMAFSNLGSILVQSGRLDEGIAQYRKALALNSNQTGHENNLGAALVRAGQLDEAILHFQRALELNRDNPEANYNLANALVQKGRLEEAVTYYNHTLRLNPGNASARDRLRKLLEQLGR